MNWVDYPDDIKFFIVNGVSIRIESKFGKIANAEALGWRKVVQLIMFCRGKNDS